MQHSYIQIHGEASRQLKRLTTKNRTISPNPNINLLQTFNEQTAFDIRHYLFYFYFGENLPKALQFLTITYKRTYFTEQRCGKKVVTRYDKNPHPEKLKKQLIHVVLLQNLIDNDYGIWFKTVAGKADVKIFSMQVKATTTTKRKHETLLTILLNRNFSDSLNVFESKHIFLQRSRFQQICHFNA